MQNHCARVQMSQMGYYVLYDFSNLSCHYFTLSQESEARNKTADNEYPSTSNTWKENEENTEKELNQQIDNKDAGQQEIPLYSSVERMGNVASENFGHVSHYIIESRSSITYMYIDCYVENVLCCFS